MSRYIDADKLWDNRPQVTPEKSLDYKAGFSECMWAFSKQIKHQIDNPTADVEEVRHGEWLPIIERSSYLDPPYYDTGKCSSCGHIVDVSEMFYKYCPECGAKMDGGEKYEQM